MSKRTLESLGSDSDDLETNQDLKKSRFKEKHSLDSDEEDTGGKYELMKEDDIEGQEDGTIELDDGIQITPFNMQEEMGEGHFDKTGTYIFDKQKEIQDNWLDNINWKYVKQGEVAEKKNDSSDSEAEPVDVKSVYMQMLDILQPGETVIRALKRLGSGSKDRKHMSASERWRKRKTEQEQGTAAGASNEDETKKKEDLLKLTELANSLLQSGRFDVYQESYEKMSFVVQQMSGVKSADVTGKDDDDALDAFGSTLDDNEAAADTSTSAPEADLVQWEYRVENSDTSAVLGPYDSAQMHTWQEEGKFKDGVYVRKVDSGGEFYSSRRVDFELYV